MNHKDNCSDCSKFKYNGENILRSYSMINSSLSNKLIHLSKQIDCVPHDYTLKPLLRYMRIDNNETSTTEYEKSCDLPEMQDDINENECYLDMNQLEDLEKNHEAKYSLNYLPITELLVKNQENQNSNYIISLFEKKTNKDSLISSFTDEQLGESYKRSNREIRLNSSNYHCNLLPFSNKNNKGRDSFTHNQYNNPNTGRKRSCFDFEYQNQGYPGKESSLKSKIFREVEKLDRERRCKITHLQKTMAKSNIDKISNHRDPRKYRLTGFSEFYKVNYMILLEKYNQAKRAYSQTLPRMQMLEIQNNILFEIIGKIHADDDGITNLLKEFIEIKSFCIHSIMKLKDELGDNYENILNLIIESNSTSEVRPWAKILSGMFNYYEIKVDDTLIQNLNTLYSINKMAQGS